MASINRTRAARKGAGRNAGRFSGVRGISAAARLLGCSKGHLSLVVRGLRESRKLEREIAERGWRLGPGILARRGPARAGLGTTTTTTKEA